MFSAGFCLVTKIAVKPGNRALASMKTAIFLVGGVLVACSLYLSEAATLYRPGLDEDAFDFDSDFKDIPNSSYHAPIAV